MIPTIICSLAVIAAIIVYAAVRRGDTPDFEPVEHDNDWNTADPTNRWGVHAANEDRK